MHVQENVIMPISKNQLGPSLYHILQRSDSVVECLCQEREVAGSSLTGVAACVLEQDILILA